MELNLNLKSALQLIGGLSGPSKMPCHAYSIPAQKCITGAKLRQVKNSICSVCYALKGNYGFPVVRDALMRRFESLTNPLWIEAMVLAIRAKEKSGFFRWHDSGDIQSVQHLQNICEIAKRLPDIKFWIPTREYTKIIPDFFAAGHKFPENLTVRLSAFMIDGPAPIAIAKKYNLTTSGVSKLGFTCPASLQGNKCLDCRACWDKSVVNINYHKH